MSAAASKQQLALLDLVNAHRVHEAALAKVTQAITTVQALADEKRTPAADLITLPAITFDDQGKPWLVTNYGLNGHCPSVIPVTDYRPARPPGDGT